MFLLKVILHPLNTLAQFKTYKINSSDLKAQTIQKVLETQNPIKIYPGYTYAYNRDIDGGSPEDIYKDHEFFPEALHNKIQKLAGQDVLKSYDMRLIDGIQYETETKSDWLLGLVEDENSKAPQLWLNLQFLEFIKFADLRLSGLIKRNPSEAERSAWTEIFILEQLQTSSNSKLAKAAKQLLKEFSAETKSNFQFWQKLYKEKQLEKQSQQIPVQVFAKVLSTEPEKFEENTAMVRNFISEIYSDKTPRDPNQVTLALFQETVLAGYDTGFAPHRSDKFMNDNKKSIKEICTDVFGRFNQDLIGFLKQEIRRQGIVDSDILNQEMLKEIQNWDAQMLNHPDAFIYEKFRSGEYPPALRKDIVLKIVEKALADRVSVEGLDQILKKLDKDFDKLGLTVVLPTLLPNGLDGKPFNAAVLIRPAGLLLFTKQILADDSRSIFVEKNYFTQGDLDTGNKFLLGGQVISIEICETGWRTEYDTGIKQKTSVSGKIYDPLIFLKSWFDHSSKLAFNPSASSTEVHDLKRIEVNRDNLKDLPEDAFAIEGGFFAFETAKPQKRKWNFGARAEKENMPIFYLNGMGPIQTAFTAQMDGSALLMVPYQKDPLVELPPFDENTLLRFRLLPGGKLESQMKEEPVHLTPAEQYRRSVVYHLRDLVNQHHFDYLTGSVLGNYLTDLTATILRDTRQMSDEQLAENIKNVKLNFSKQNMDWNKLTDKERKILYRNMEKEALRVKLYLISIFDQKLFQNIMQGAKSHIVKKMVIMPSWLFAPTVLIKDIKDEIKSAFLGYQPAGDTTFSKLGSALKYEADKAISFGELPVERLYALGMSVDDAKALHQEMVEKGYINSSGEISGKVFELENMSSIDISESFEKYSVGVQKLFYSATHSDPTILVSEFFTEALSTEAVQGAWNLFGLDTLYRLFCVMMLGNPLNDWAQEKFGFARKFDTKFSKRQLEIDEFDHEQIGKFEFLTEDFGSDKELNKLFDALEKDLNRKFSERNVEALNQLFEENYFYYGLLENHSHFSTISSKHDKKLNKMRQLLAEEKKPKKLMREWLNEVYKLSAVIQKPAVKIKEEKKEKSLTEIYEAAFSWLQPMVVFKRSLGSAIIGWDHQTSSARKKKGFHLNPLTRDQVETGNFIAGTDLVGRRFFNDVSEATLLYTALSTERDELADHPGKIWQQNFKWKIFKALFWSDWHSLPQNLMRMPFNMALTYLKPNQKAVWNHYWLHILKGLKAKAETQDSKKYWQKEIDSYSKKLTAIPADFKMPEFSKPWGLSMWSLAFYMRNTPSNKIWGKTSQQYASALVKDFMIRRYVLMRPLIDPNGYLNDEQYAEAFVRQYDRYKQHLFKINQATGFSVSYKTAGVDSQNPASPVEPKEWVREQVLKVITEFKQGVTGLSDFEDLTQVAGKQDLLVFKNTPGKWVDRSVEFEFYKNKTDQFFAAQKDKPALIVFDGFYAGLDQKVLNYVKTLNANRKPEHQVQVVVLSSYQEQMDRIQLSDDFSDWNYLLYIANPDQRQKKLAEWIRSHSGKVHVVEGGR